MSDQNVLTELLVKVLSAFDEASNKQALAAVDKQQDQITGKEKKGQADRTKNLAASLATGLKHVEGYTKGALNFAEKITLGFASVVTAIEGGAVAGTFALAKLSKGLSDAYYSGQKVGSAVKDMEAFRFASEQMGSSAEKAQAGINELGHLRNTNPGAYVGLLQRLGVAATDAAGKLRSPAQAAMDLAPALAKLPRQMQLLYGNQLGMDDDQTLAMTRPEFLAKIRQFKEMQATMGFDPDKAAADGAKFQQVWGRASAALDIITQKIESAFLGRVGGSLDKVTTWVVKNADKITNAVVRVGDFVVHLATSFVDLVTSFDKLSPSAQHFLELLGGLVALSLTLRSGPIAAIMALAAAIAFLWDDYEKYKEGLPSIIDWASWEPKIKAAIDGLSNLWTKFDELSTKLTGQGGLQVAMEAFAVYMAGAWVAKILGAFASVGSGWLGLMARIGLLNPAVLGTAAVGAVLASGDPNKALLSGGRPDLQPQDNDLGLPGIGEDRKTDTSDVKAKVEQVGGLWDRFKKAIGWGDRLHDDDPRVKDAILATAEATQKLAEKADRVSAEGGDAAGGGGGGAMAGVRRALGWAGRAAGYSPASGGGTTPAKGALAANQKEAYAAALAEGLSPTAARALVANMNGEGLAVPHDRHWDSTHYAQGIVQWDPTRTAAIAAKFGKEPMNMSVAEQTRAAIWEMKNKYPTTWRALQGDNGADMIGALVDDYERPGNSGRAKAQRMGYYRGFNPGDAGGGGAKPTVPTVTVNGTPSHSDTPVGDQAAFDAQNRIIAGKSRPGDRALIDRHRQEQNAPVVSDRNPDGTLKFEFRTLGRYVGITRPMAAKGEMPHPHEIGPYHAPLDAARQRLADAMRSGALHPLPSLHLPLGVSASSLYQGYDTHHAGSRNVEVNQHIAIHGINNPKDIEHHLKVHAKRGVQDTLRHMQGPSQ